MVPDDKAGDWGQLAGDHELKSSPNTAEQPHAFIEIQAASHFLPFVCTPVFRD